jgi:ADP-ribose pyrophosphatase YjhB (NUDIX family)
VVARGHVVVGLDDERVVLLREVHSGSVTYSAPGVRVAPGETPGHAAVRAAREQLGLDVEVTGLLFADCESGADHYFFLATPLVLSHRAWDQSASASGDAVSISALKRSALLGYPVRPIGIARGLRHQARRVR